jgi:hypothetical protein
MAQNLDPQDIEAIVDGLRTLGTAARESGNSVRGAIDSSIGQSKKLDEANKARHEKTAASLQRLGNSALAFSSQLTSGAGSFSSLNTVVGLATKTLSGFASLLGPLSGVAQGIINAGGDIALELIKTFDKTYGIFEQLADTGVLQQFEDLESSISKTGMNVTDTGKVLAKFSKELGAYGGSVISGRKDFELVAVSSRGIRDDFQKLGISVGDFNDLQLTYISQQQKWGLIGNKNTKDLRDGTKTYIEELDTLTKLTGLQKKDIQTMRDQAMSETRFAAAMAQLPEHVQKSANDLNVVLKSAGAESIAQGLRDMMSGSVSTDAAKQFVQQTGGMGVEIVQRIRNGTLGAIDGFNEIKKAAGTVIGPMGQLAQHVGDASLYTKSYAELRNLVNRKEITPQEMDAILKKRKETLESTTGQNAELANTKQRLYDLGVEIEKFMVSSKTATWAMDKLADGTYTVLTKMFEFAGQEVPKEIKLKKQLIDSMKEEVEAKEKLKKAKTTRDKEQQTVKDLRRIPTKEEEEQSVKRIKTLESEIETLNKEKKSLDSEHDKEIIQKLESQINALHQESRKEEKNLTPGTAQAVSAAETRLKHANIELTKAESELARVQNDIKTNRTDLEKTQTLSTVKASGIGQTNPNSSPATVGKEYIPGTGKYEGLNIKSTEVYGGTTKGGADTDEMLLAKIKEFAKQFPGTRITAFNDLAKRDSDSKHLKGKAVDFTLDPAPKTEKEADEIVKLLGDMGFTGKNREEYFKKSPNWTGPHFHAEMMAKGGITRGISIAGERGPEAVVPLPDGRTIPVEIKNQRYSNVGNLDNFEIQNLANTFKESIAELKRQQEATNARLLELIQESKVNNQHVSNVNETLMASKRIQGNLLTHTMS